MLNNGIMAHKQMSFKMVKIQCYIQHTPSRLLILHHKWQTANNAMPLIPHSGQGTSSFDGSKPLPMVHQNMIGPSVPRTQPPNYDVTTACYPQHLFRSHPYSFSKRPNSSLSSRIPIQGQGTSGSVPYTNNHSSTDKDSHASQGESVGEIDHIQSRSSSTGSNRHASPTSSLNNTTASDSSLQNDPSLPNSCTLSTVIDVDEDPPNPEESPCISTEDDKQKSSKNSDLSDEVTSPQEPKNEKRFKVDIRGEPEPHPVVVGDRQSTSSHSGQIGSSTNRSSTPTTSLSPSAATRQPGRAQFTNNPALHSTRCTPHARGHHQLVSAPGDGVEMNTTSHKDTSASGQSTSQKVCLQLVNANRGLQVVSNGTLISAGAPLSFASAQPNGMPFTGNTLSLSTCVMPSASYADAMTMNIWQFYTGTRQSTTKYARKVHLRSSLHVVVSGVFENAGLFIVGSSMNGFGSDQSDMDMCLTITSRDLQQKTEAFLVLSQLLPPLRKCSFIRNLHLIRAKVPILKFRDTYAGVDCDLNVNNVVGIYNTHLLAMYTRVDWRVRPLGMFVKHWAQRMDIHDGSRGRLSTYPLLLMLIHYLQASCSPPVLPNLQAKFPKIFNYARPLSELDMGLQLPWDELRSHNTASLAELFIGFVHYYTNEFDFSHWAVSIRHGAPLPIDMAIRRLPPHEQAPTARSFKVFVEEPFCQSNAARSLYDDSVFTRIRQAFLKTHQALRSHRPLDSVWINANSEAV